MISAGEAYRAMSRSQRFALAREFFPLWARDFAVAPQTGQAIQFKGRPWLWDLYDCEAKEIVVRKGNQVGVTLWALLKTLHSAAFRWPQGAAYFLPKAAHVGDFVRQKVQPIFRACPDLRGGDDDRTDNMGMKRVGQSFVFFRGMESEGGRQTFSADGEILDERDLMDPAHVDDALRRTSGSLHRERIDISRPSVPGFGIDKRFQESDQRFWNLKCGKCNKEWTVEETWPNCVRGRDGARYLSCPSCGDPADIKAGRWVVRYPDKQVAGFQVNGLLTPAFDLEAEWKTWEEQPGMFSRAILGMPYMEREQGMTADAVMGQCSRNYAQLERHPGPTRAGADVGTEGHLVVVEAGTDQPTKIKPRRIIALRRWKEWSELDKAMEDFSIQIIVVDAMPEKRNARDFCARWPGRAYMAFYDENRKGKPKWDDRERRVQADRTETLDASFAGLYTGTRSIPRPEDVESRLFAAHVQNLIRVIEELPNGDKVARWAKIGPDHYRHADNYAMLALSKPVYKTVGI
jgi:hypothetical protein